MDSYKNAVGSIVEDNNNTFLRLGRLLNGSVCFINTLRQEKNGFRFDVTFDTFPFSLNISGSIVLGWQVNWEKGFLETKWSFDRVISFSCLSLISLKKPSTSFLTWFSWRKSLLRCSWLLPSTLWRYCTKCPVPSLSHRAWVFRNYRKRGLVAVASTYNAGRCAPYNSTSEKLSTIARIYPTDTGQFPVLVLYTRRKSAALACPVVGIEQPVLFFGLLNSFSSLICLHCWLYTFFDFQDVFFSSSSSWIREIEVRSCRSISSTLLSAYSHVLIHVGNTSSFFRTVGTSCNITKAFTVRFIFWRKLCDECFRKPGDDDERFRNGERLPY